MPCKDFTELVCDWLGAARAYEKETFSYQREYEWWKEKRKKCAMNERNKIMLDIIFSDLACSEKNNDKLQTPELIIKSKYIQKVWKANAARPGEDNNGLENYK